MFVTISIVNLLPFCPILVWLSDILHLREEGVVSQARPSHKVRGSGEVPVVELF